MNLASSLISVNEFINRISQRAGAMILVFETLTDGRAKKTGNPYGRITKRAKVKGMVNFRYEEGVLRRLEKEGKSPEEFEKGESWHEVVLDSQGRLTPFCRHKQTGELYIRFMHQETLGETQYFSEKGDEISAEQAKMFLPKPSGYLNQGLDQPLIFLTYKLDSIHAVMLDGERLVIMRQEAVAA